MTLILTETSPWGIAMAADSAVTQEVKTRDGRWEYRVLMGVRKLQVIDKLNAGIAVWGQGEIILEHTENGDLKMDTDMWLKDFIRVQRNNYNSIDNFAVLLQNELRTYIPPIDATARPDGSIGFLLAGYVDYKGERLPSLYHIHNGRSSTLEMRGIHVANPNVINANHDIPPDEAQEIFAKGQIWITRNGDYVTYVRLFEHIAKFLGKLPTENGIFIPDSRNIKERAEWLKFQINTMSELYRLSNRHLPTIGGKVDTLIITPNGIDDSGLTV